MLLMLCLEVLEINSWSLSIILSRGKSAFDSFQFFIYILLQVSWRFELSHVSFHVVNICVNLVNVILRLLSKWLQLMLWSLDSVHKVSKFLLNLVWRQERVFRWLHSPQHLFIQNLHIFVQTRNLPIKLFNQIPRLKLVIILLFFPVLYLAYDFSQFLLNLLLKLLMPLLSIILDLVNLLDGWLVVFFSYTLTQLWLHIMVILKKLLNVVSMVRESLFNPEFLFF